MSPNTSCQVASFNSSGITYHQIKPKNGLSFSGFNGTCGPHPLTKVEQEREFPPLVPVQVSKPVTPIVVNLVCAAIVDNVVASSSQMTLEDIPATVPLVECISTPTVMPLIILGLNQAYKVQVQSSSVQYQKSPKSLSRANVLVKKPSKFQVQ